MRDLLNKWFDLWLPPDSGLSQRAKFVSAGGAFLGMALVASASAALLPAAWPVLVASMGASAVILFAAPSSPMARPWALMGGHLISAVVGVTCAQWIHDPVVGGAAAVALAIFVMHQLRCLHPPGGATALVAVIGGPAIHALGYAYVLAPIGINAVLMLVGSVVFLRLSRRRTFVDQGRADQEWGNQEASAADAWDGSRTPFDEDDLRYALQSMDTFVDISREDLSKIYTLATLHAQANRLAGLRCGDLMSTDVLSAEFATELEEAWAWFRERGISAVPVVNPARRVIGIVTVTDFFHHADHSVREESLTERLKRFVRRTPGFHAEKAEVVGQIMTAPVVTVREDDPVTGLFDVFTEGRFHHLPVVDADGRLVGMLTRDDLLAALAPVLPDVTARPEPAFAGAR